MYMVLMQSKNVYIKSGSLNSVNRRDFDNKENDESNDTNNSIL